MLSITACGPEPEPPPPVQLPPAPAPATADAAVPETVPVYTYRVENVYPHDPEAFTQGLVYDGGFLYEGTGLFGRSSLRRVELETGEVMQIYHLPEEYFGEGIAIDGNTIIQLTWKNYTGFVYSKKDFSLLRSFSYNGQGWGIAGDGERLVMSNGTANLTFLENDAPATTVEVMDGDTPVGNLNELEYVNGKILANVWRTDRIAIIEPADGKVTGWVNLTGLLQTQAFSGEADVLNGIAYDAATDRLFVTGKLWPFLFEIELVEN